MYIVKKRSRILFLTIVLLAALSLASALADNGVLTLPTDTTVIEAEAFRGVTGAGQIDLPAGVTEIGANAFRDCGDPSAQLRYYFLPAGVQVGAGAFENCRAVIRLDGTELPRIYYTVSDSGATITGSGGDLRDVVIPNTLGGKPVVAIGNNAFNGRDAMTSVVIPGTVNSLGTRAFRDCSSLTEITLPAGITSLPEGVFEGDRKLEQITLQGTLTAIGSYAFNDCYVLTGFEIPSTVTQIGSYAFRYCKALTQATVPSGITALAERTFTDCISLQNIQLPAGLESIGKEAFNGCTALTEIELPASLTSLGTAVFFNCSALTSISLPSGITALPTQTFQGCTALTEVGLPTGLTSIGSNVFNNCSSLTSVSLPAGITSLPNEAFRNANGLTTIQLPAGLTTLGTSVFYDCRALTSVSLPSGITSLPNNTFGNCYALEEVSLPAGLTSLGTGVFCYCKALTEIDLPAGITSLPNETFYGCSSLEAIDLTGITSLGTSALRSCTSLTEVTIPEGITVLPNSLFEESTGLTQVHLPSTLTTINDYAFHRCRALTEITIPTGVTAIPYGAFDSCSALQSVQLPAGVESIAQNAFRSCTALTSINFPDGLTSIGNEAFRDSCVGQSANAVYVLPDSLETIGSGAFYNCGAGLLVAKGSERENFVKQNGYTFTYNANTGFRYQYKSDILYLTAYKGTGGSVTIPAEATVIGEEAFANNTAITAITIPNTVTTLNTRAFYYCTNLARVTMADSVTTINVGVFAYCAKLTNVTFSANLTTIDADAFDYACTVSGTHYYYLPDHITTLGWTPFSDCGAVPCYNRGSDTATLFRSNNNTSSIHYTYVGETDFRYRWYNGEGTEGHEERLMKYVGSKSSVSIPAYIWLIDNEAFMDHTELTSVVIPEGVKQINTRAFQGCTGLTQVTFPDTLIEVWDNAFKDCGAAVSETPVYTLPSNIEKLGNNSFGTDAILRCDWTSRTAESISNRGYDFARLDRPDTELDIRYRWGYIDHVWSKALYDYVGSASSVTLPDDCPNAWSDRFLEKPSLELLCSQLSDTATALSAAGVNFTFPGHEGIRYREINGALCVMGWTGQGTTLSIPVASGYIAAGWDEHIYSKAFKDQTNLTKAILPEGLVCIEDSAFIGCLNLVDVTFPDSLKVLENHAFEQCGKNADYLHYYVLPDYMTSVATNTDAAWGAFTDINMGRVSCAPDTSTALQVSGIDDHNHGGSYRFALKGHETDCLLYHYDLYPTETQGQYEPRLVLKIYEGTGTEVTIPSGVGLYRIENAVFMDRTSLQSVTMPTGLVEIGESAFRGCTTLHTSAETDVIRVPSTVKYIGDYAFNSVGSAITDRFYLILPSGLEMETFSINIIEACNAVFVVAGGPAATALYNNWYYYYSTLADAIAQENCHFQRYIVDGHEVYHVHYGRQ